MYASADAIITHNLQGEPHNSSKHKAQSDYDLAFFKPTVLDVILMLMGFYILYLLLHTRFILVV